MADFFISHSTADAEWAEWIGWQLESAGYSIALMSWDYRPGSNFIMAMSEAARLGNRLIVLLSPEFANAIFTQAEWQAAFPMDPSGMEGRLLPIRVREGPLPTIFGHVVYLDLVGSSEEEARRLLLSAVSRAQKPKTMPLFPARMDTARFPPDDAAREKHGSSKMIRILAYYAREDLKLYNIWSRKHLKLLPRKIGGLNLHLDGRELGVDTDPGVAMLALEALDNSDVILIFLSPDFLVSPLMDQDFLERAAKRHKEGCARVLPVILRPCAWRGFSLSKFQVLPRNQRPISEWESLDQAFDSVASDLRRLLEDFSLPSRLPTRRGRPANREAKPRQFQIRDVFMVSGVPTITFVEPEDFSLIKLSLVQPGRGLVIQGPSGIGKTTALKTAVARLSQEGDHFPIRILSARSARHRGEIAKLEVSHEGIVAIDDFHRLEGHTREAIADYMKYLADFETVDRKIVIIGIPRTGQRLVDTSFDVATRIDFYQFGKVSDRAILDMISKGENALNITFERPEEIVRASGGSLNIAQLLCFHTVARTGTVATEPITKVIPSAIEEVIGKAFTVTSLKFKELVRRFASLGLRHDLTALTLLQELAIADEGFLSLTDLKYRRPELAQSIAGFLSKNYMTSFYDSFPSADNHLWFDSQAPALIIDDPQLTFHLQHLSTDQLMRELGKTQPKSRIRVFISYSHADSEWLKRLLVHLKPLERRGIIDAWSDAKIRTGALWKEEIVEALDAARVAVLLISANFLASDFIDSNELPRLLTSSENEGARIIPVIVGPSRFERMPELSKFQAVNPGLEPLISMDNGGQEAVLHKLADEIEALVTDSSV